MASAGAVQGRWTGRNGLIDQLRGIALVAMAIYHALWDATYLGLIDIGIGVSPFWISVQRSILAAFLLLAGVSLVLAHGDGIRWASFWRRWLMIAGGAALVTLGTYFALPDYVAYFGVLHAIALFSLLALPLIRAPLWIAIAAAAIAMGAAFYPSPVFNNRALSWIGFFTSTPPTTDLVPVFPWFGVLLVGVIAARLGRRSLPQLQELRDPMFRSLQLLGRWSLLFYLLHQPLLWSALYGIAALKPDEAVARAQAFTQSCNASCSDNAKFCTAYCQCALELVSREDLWFAINADPPTGEQRQSVNQLVGLCTAMAGARAQ